jgi:hypothetical protein
LVQEDSNTAFGLHIAGCLAIQKIRFQLDLVWVIELIEDVQGVFLASWPFMV